jgi:hypothetical protein
MPARRGRMWASRSRTGSPRSASTRPTPTSSTSPPSASTGAERGARRLQEHRRRHHVEAVLFRDDKTGADRHLDRSQQPQRAVRVAVGGVSQGVPDVVGGPGSGLFKSTDGGETWTEVTRNPGMPTGLVGRIGVAVSGANSNRVYALVENEKGGLFRSDDAGATWTLVNDKRRHPPARLLLHARLCRSEERRRGLHAEHVVLPLHRRRQDDDHDRQRDARRLPRPVDRPRRPRAPGRGQRRRRAVSSNTGGKWTAQDFPTEQFYHAVTTTHTPYHVCGSQQDNSTLCVPFNWNGRPSGWVGRSAAAAAARPRGPRATSR